MLYALAHEARAYGVARMVIANLRNVRVTYAVRTAGTRRERERERDTKQREVQTGERVTPHVERFAPWRVRFLERFAPWS